MPKIVSERKKLATQTERMVEAFENGIKDVISLYEISSNNYLIEDLISKGYHTKFIINAKNTPTSSIFAKQKW